MRIMCVHRLWQDAEEKSEPPNPSQDSRESEESSELLSIDKKAERIVLKVWEVVTRENKIGNNGFDQYERFYTIVKEVAEELMRIENEERSGASRNEPAGSQPRISGWAQQEAGVDY